MKKVFKNLRMLGLMLVLAMAFCSCKANNTGNPPADFSDKYLVAVTSAGNSFGPRDFWNGMYTEYRICYDGTVEIYMPAVQNMELTDPEFAGSYQLTKDETDYLLKAINQKKLYKLDPKLDKKACDATGKYMLLYDKNNDVLKECGGYCPTNKDFNAMYDAIKNTLHKQEHATIREAWIEKQKAANEESANM